MSDAKENLYKKIHQTLFLPREEAAQVLTPSQLERKQRIMLAVTKKMDDPMISDKMLVDFLTSGCDGSCRNVPKTTAYRDVAMITRMFGNIQLASKAWYRYMIVEGAKEAYRIAKEAKDGKAMAAALDKIGKYTRADKEDDPFDWDTLVPPSFEPSADVTLLGEDVEEIENLEERRKELRALFRKGKHIQDAIVIHDTDEE